MKKFLIASIVSLVSVVSVAHAADTCILGEACDLQKIQEGKADYVGKVAPTPKAMVCLTALATKPSALVLAKGRVKEGEAVTGKEITSWRTQRSHWTKTLRGYEREICIPSSMLESVVTLCNDENRSIWESGDVRYLKRAKRIPTKDATCLLGKKACKKIGL